MILFCVDGERVVWFNPIIWVNSSLKTEEIFFKVNMYSKDDNVYNLVRNGVFKFHFDSNQ